MATIVVIITSMVAANATQSLTTPNAAFISYSLAAGVNSAPIALATSRSVLVMGCCTTLSDQGVGQVTLQHIPSAGGIQWVGLESWSGAAITSGFRNIANFHIVYIDGAHTVDIEVASADTILIHNGAAATRAGNVTLVW